MNNYMRKKTPVQSQITTAIIITVIFKYLSYILLHLRAHTLGRLSVISAKRDNFSITKTRLFKYTENFTNKNWKFSDKKSDIFLISALKHRLWVLDRTASPIYSCKPQFYFIKMGFKGVKRFRDGDAKFVLLHTVPSAKMSDLKGKKGK